MEAGLGWLDEHFVETLRVVATSHSPQRNLEVEYLAELRDRFRRRYLPIISVDTKKPELVGNSKNPGQRWESASRCVYDHDFRTDSIGGAIPYGIYDVTENCGALVIGVSHDTPAFAAHAIAYWWQQKGSTRYRGSRQMLILADTGSNSCRCYAWKAKVQFQLPTPTRCALMQSRERNRRCPGCEAERRMSGGHF